MATDSITRVTARALAAVGCSLALCVATAAGVSPTAHALEPVTTVDAVGDFETSGPTVYNWSISATSPNSIVTIGSRAISGSRSMRVQDTSTAKGTSATAPAFAVTPGRTVSAQAYAYVTSGEQSFTMIFYSASGSVVQRVTSPARATGLAWSRISLAAVTPSTATKARLQISSSIAGVSEGWWDAIAQIAPVTPNSGFESKPTSTQPVPGWSASGSGGASVITTSSDHYAGAQAALIRDTSTTGYASLQSPLVPVFPAVGTLARLMVKPTSGRVTMTVRWYTSGRSPISSSVYPLSLTTGKWQAASRVAPAPANAHFAAVQVSTTNASTAVAAIDSVSITPAAGAAVRPSTTSSLGQPLDRFSNYSATGMVNVNGRAKMYTVVSGYPSQFQVVDVQTGKIEVKLSFPSENNSSSSAMTTGRDGAVYIGAQGGQLFRWRPGATSLQSLGRVTPTATSLYDLETGPDGRIWGGTYPGGELFSYTPGAAAAVNHGKVATGATYARSIAVDQKYVYVAVGSVRPTLWRIEQASPSTRTQIALPVQLTSGNIPELEVYGRFLALAMPSGTTTSGTTSTASRYLYDLTARTWNVSANLTGQSPTGMDSRQRFFYLTYHNLQAVDQNGRSVALVRTDMSAGTMRHLYIGPLDGVQGEWLITHAPGQGIEAINVTTYKSIVHRFSFAPVALRMKSLASGPNGTLYAGGYGGPSLGVVTASTGAHASYPYSATAKNGIGEVEGAITQGQYQFLGTYTRSKIFRLDTTKPWADGTNPTLIADLGGRGQDRPQGWATSGQRTFFGTVPGYGRLGGVLGIIDTPTSAPRIVDQPVKGQSVVSLAASGSVVYGGTSRWGGLGATPTTTTAKVFAYDASGSKLLWSVAPAAGVQSYGAVLVTPDGSLWAAAGPVLYQLDRATGKTLRKITVNSLAQPTTVAWKNVDLEYLDGLLYLATIDRIYTVDPVTLRVEMPVPSGVTHRHLAVVGGAVYYPAGPELRKIAR